MAPLQNIDRAIFIIIQGKLLEYVWERNEQSELNFIFSSIT